MTLLPGGHKSMCAWHARVSPGGPGCGLQIRRPREGQRLDSSSPASRMMPGSSGIF